jgi:hypothetical protein
MVHKRTQALKKRAEELPRVFVLLIGIFIGGIVGVLFAVAAFSAFLFQFLSALRDATLALATVVLAIATISLYRATSVLASSTSFLAEIESKRDRRANLARRIQLGENLTRAEPTVLLDLMKQPLYFVIPEQVSWVRQLRRLIKAEEGETDDEIRQVLPLLDQFIRMMELSEKGEKVVVNPDRDVIEWIKAIQNALRTLVQRWSSQIQELQE